MQKLLVVTGQEDANKHGTAVMSSAVRTVAGAEGILDLTGQCWMRGLSRSEYQDGMDCGKISVELRVGVCALGRCWGKQHQAVTGLAAQGRRDATLGETRGKCGVGGMVQ